MAETHVLSALKEKRARLAGELEACKLRVTALTVELGSVIEPLRLSFLSSALRLSGCESCALIHRTKFLDGSYSCPLSGKRCLEIGGRPL